MKADKRILPVFLKTARGQLDGIVNMVEDDRYCIDISNQLLATQAILNKVNKKRNPSRAYGTLCQGIDEPVRLRA